MHDVLSEKFLTCLLTLGIQGVYNIWRVQNGTQSLSRVAEGIGPMKPGNLGVTQTPYMRILRRRKGAKSYRSYF